MSQIPSADELLMTKLLGKTIPDSGKTLLGFAWFTGIYGKCGVVAVADPDTRELKTYISPIDGEDPWIDVQKIAGGGAKFPWRLGVELILELGVFKE